MKKRQPGHGAEFLPGGIDSGRQRRGRRGCLIAKLWAARQTAEQVHVKASARPVGGTQKTTQIMHI